MDISKKDLEVILVQDIKRLKEAGWELSATLTMFDYDLRFSSYKEEDNNRYDTVALVLYSGIKPGGEEGINKDNDIFFEYNYAGLFRILEKHLAEYYNKFILPSEDLLGSLIERIENMY